MYQDIKNAKELLDKQIITNADYKKIKNKCLTKLFTADLDSLYLDKEIDNLIELRDIGAIEQNELLKIFDLYAEELNNRNEILIELKLTSKMLLSFGNRDFNSAIKYCDKIVKIKPSMFWIQDALLVKGEALSMLGEHHSALKCYENILKFDPNNKEALLRISQFYD